jgi:hypothetical protein
MRRIKLNGGFVLGLALGKSVRWGAIVSLFASTLSASPALDSVQNVVRESKNLIEESSALVLRFRQKTGANAELPAQLATLFEKTEKLAERADTAASEVEADLARTLERFDTQSGKRLQQVRNEFAAALAKFKGTSEVKDRLENFDPLFGASGVGPWLAPVVRAALLEGGTSLDQVLELLEQVASGSLLASVQLQLAQSAAFSGFLEEELEAVPLMERQWPSPRVSLAFYLQVRALQEQELNRLRALFPTFPSLSLQSFQNETQNKALITSMDGFASEFFRSGAKINTNQLDRVRRTLSQLIGSYAEVQNYSPQAFPNLAASDESTRLASTLLSKPEFQECAYLARGLVTSPALEGAPCDLQNFPTALKAYTAHHKKLAGYGLLPPLIELISSKEAGIRNGTVSWAQIFEEADKMVADLSGLSEESGHLWQKARPAILAHTVELERRLGNGLELHDALASLLLQSGVNPLLGLDTEFNPTLFEASDLAKRFETVLSSGAKKIERLTATSDCRPFSLGSRADSPYVVWTRRLAPMDPAGSPWTGESNSTHGFQKLVWQHEARIGNAVNLPRTAHPTQLLAGSLKWTALSRYVPNLILLKLFQGSMGKEDSLSALGVKDSFHEFDRLFTNHKKVPDWSTVVHESRAAFFTMLNGFANSNPDLLETEKKSDPNYLRVLFRERYRQEFLIAAKEMRKWEEEYERLTTGSATEDRYNAIRGAPPSELCALFGLPPDACPKRLEAGLATSLMRDLFPRIKQGYLQRHAPLKLKSETDTQYQARLQAISKGTQITPEMFLEELVMHKGVIGGDAPVAGLDSEELLRWQKYRQYIPEEQYRLWASRVSSLQKVYEHTLNISDRRQSTLSSMRSILFHLFPPLRVEAPNPRTGKKEQSWSWVSDAPSDFDLVMDAYVSEATRLMNDVQGLSSEEDVVDYFLPILPLVDQTLAFFPENKRSVCDAFSSKHFWENVETATVVGLEVGGAAAMGLGPAGVAVGAGAVAIALTVDYSRLRQEGLELARSKAHELASWSQVNLETSSRSTATVDALEKAYLGSQTTFAVRAGLTAATAGFFGVKNLAAFTRLPRSVSAARNAYITGMRADLGLKALPPTHLWRYGSRFPGRITRAVFKLDGKAYDKLMRPLDRAGFVSKWVHPTLAERWAGVTFNKAHPLLSARAKSAAVWKWSLNVFAENPASLLGYSNGLGVVGKSLAAASFTSVLYLLRHSAERLLGFGPEAEELFWNHLAAEPERYEPLMLRVLNAEMSSETLLAVIRADSAFRKQWEDTTLKLVKDPSFPRDQVIQELEKMRSDLEASLAQGTQDGPYVFPRKRMLRELDRRLREMR